MKKLLSIILALALVVSLAACSGNPEPVKTLDADKTVADQTQPADEPTAAPADDQPVDEPTAEPAEPVAADATISITISDGSGKLVVSNLELAVNDIDSDGKLTVNDALECADNAFYTGGDGYTSGETMYGLSITKLWGDECGSYGYYLNDGMCWGLTDEIKAGDYLAAFVYTDAAGYSDAYSYFDKKTADAAAGESVTLTLSNSTGFDDNFLPVFAATSGAVITVNGEDTTFTTAEDGTVSLTFDTAGEYVVSARSDSVTLVPPVCVINVQ